MNPESSTTPNNTPGQTPPAANRTKLIVGIVVAVVILLALIIVLIFMQMSSKPEPTTPNNTNNSATNNNNQQSEPSEEVVELSSLTDANLQAPDSLPGYSLSQSTERQAQYKKQTPTGACELTFGTASAEEAPGSDSEAMVNQVVESQRQQGATVVQEVTPGTPLHLKSADGKTTYSLPSYEFGMSAQGRNTTIHYSPVVLKGGNRVVVTRSCSDQKDIAELDQLAAKLIVTPKE